MHEFSELAERCANFGLARLSEFQDEVLEQLETSGETRLVKALQMIELQKAVLAVGMFSMFEAELQSQLGGGDGFVEANKILTTCSHIELQQKFLDFQLAINVLKHGSGRSYDALVLRAEQLTFRVKLRDEAFYNEGDVSEVSTLVLVDDIFVRSCADIIKTVSRTLREIRAGKSKAHLQS